MSMHAAIQKIERCCGPPDAAAAADPWILGRGGSMKPMCVDMYVDMHVIYIYIYI